MRVAFLMGGGAPLIKRYMAGTTISTAGIPLLGAVDAGTDFGSVEPIVASDAATPALVGLALSPSGTVSATSQTVEADLFCEVVVNPNLVIGARANAGTTSGTALATTVTTAADSTGVTATGTTTFDNGWLYGTVGGNAGLFRRTDDTAGSTSINFVNAIGSGDEFVAVHGFPGSIQADDFEAFDLTTDLTEIVAQTAVVDTDNFATLDIITDVNAATTKTEYLLVSNNHLYASLTLGV